MITVVVKFSKLLSLELIIVLPIGLFILLFNAKVARAETLRWVKSNGVGSYSQEVRIAPSNASIVYATSRNGGFSGLFKSTDGGLNFTNIFPLMMNRDVNSVAISYSNPDKLCIGTYEQGVFCSTDAGSNFSNTGWQNSHIQTAVRFTAVDPTNDNVFFVGTGSNNDGGIYKTIDSGASWIRVGASTYGGQNTLNIVVDTLDHNKIFAGADSHLHRSYDGGENWIALSEAPNTNSPATVIDRLNTSTVYTAPHSLGIYKSVNGGNNWLPKNINIEHAFIFRLSQDDNGYLYGSQIGLPGLWRSKDGAETWENVADPAWATASGNTWGLDARNGRILVSVEGLGLYAANADGSPITPPPPPPAPPDAVVFVPGFGGSWSYGGLILNQPTTYADWQLIPKLSDSYYQPLLDTLAGAGLTPDQNLFTFAYDYRKSIVETGRWLNDFLAAKLLPRQKASIVAHSMGGLVTRYCFEKVVGCKDKINKIITGGTPHRGVVQAYDFWEGGKIDENDLMIKAAEKLLLHLSGLPKINSKDIVQANFPGVRDALPIFDYISGRPYSAMSILGQNPILQSLWPMSDNFKSSLTALSGDSLKTTSGFTTKKLNPRDLLFSLWVDGKPNKDNFGLGDGTVLKTSSQNDGMGNKYYSFEHKDYFRSAASLSDVLSILGLTGNPIINGSTINSFLTVYTSPGVSAGLLNTKGKAIFAKDLKPQKYNLTIDGERDGDFRVDMIFTKLTSDPVEKTFAGKIRKGEKKTFNIDTN